MTNLGVFRDDFYNAIHALPAAQSGNGPTATGVVIATLLAGANVCTVALGGTSQTFTTDTAINIIAQLQNAVAAAAKANVGGFASALGAVPPLGVPNLFNVSWTIEFSMANVTTGCTFAGGTGVTLSNITGLSSTSVTTGAPSTTLPAASVRYVVTVTSATTLTMTRVS